MRPEKMSTQPMPKWAMKKYALLWSKLKTKEFDYSLVSALLKEKNANLVSVLLTHMRKNGWIQVKLDPIDTRKRIYVLTDPIAAVEQMAI